MNGQKIAIFHHDVELMNVYGLMLKYAGYCVAKHDFSRMQPADVPVILLETRSDLVVLSVERRHVSPHDIRFGGGDSKEGLEALTEVRNHPEFSRLPIIMTSPTEENRDEALGMGATNYFARIHYPAELVEMVRQHLPIN